MVSEYVLDRAQRLKEYVFLSSIILIVFQGKRQLRFALYRSKCHLNIFLIITATFVKMPCDQHNHARPKDIMPRGMRQKGVVTQV